MFEIIDGDLLVRPCGGVTMRMTQFGYRNDPYLDRETRLGHGAYHSLVRDESIALTDSALRLLGLTRTDVRHHNPWVQIKLRGGGTLLRRVDDRCPSYRHPRVDLYQPGGYDSGLPDYADVRLVPRARAVR